MKERKKKFKKKIVTFEVHFFKVVVTWKLSAYLL